MRPLSIELLTQDAFAPFGELIHPSAAKRTYAVNDGTATRYHELARVDCDAEGGRPIISIFRATPRELPFAISMLERHPLGSQAFMPLGVAPYLVVVGTAPDAAPRAFFAVEGQGVSFHRGTWHHPLFALRWVSDFLVVDRAGAGANCEEMQLADAWIVEAVPEALS